jgi:hypothetical protein
VDGDGEAARLSHPGCLRLSPDGNTLYFLDQGGLALRALDLNTTSVKTVAELGPVTADKGISNFDFDGTQNGFYFSCPSAASLIHVSLDGRTTRVAETDGIFAGGDLKFVVANGEFLYLSPSSNRVVGFQERLLGTQPAPTPIAVMGPYAAPVVFGKVVSKDQSFAVVFDPSTNSFHVYNLNVGTSFDLTFTDTRGINSGEAALAASRHMLVDPRGLDCDVDERVAYVADAGSNRIMGFRLNNRVKALEFGASAMQVANYSPVKPPAVKRNVLLGGSVCFVSDTITPDLLFPLQFEEYWNLFNHLSGQAEQEEVIFQGMNMGFMAGGGLSFALAYPGSWTSAHVDRVILSVTYFDVLHEALAFMQAATPDDMAPAFVDNEWVSMDQAERDKATGPLSLAFKNALLRKGPGLCPGILTTKQGGIYIPGNVSKEPLLGDADLKRQILAIYEHRVRALAAQAHKEHCDLIAVLVPVRNQLSAAEMSGGGEDPESHPTPALIDEDLKGLFGRLDIPFYNMTSEMRVLDAVHFPLVRIGDAHYNTRGHHWLGFLLGWMLSRSGREASAASNPVVGPIEAKGT